jgi:hypothetical protein
MIPSTSMSSSVSQSSLPPSLGMPDFSKQMKAGFVNLKTSVVGGMSNPTSTSLGMAHSLAYDTNNQANNFGLGAYNNNSGSYDVQYMVDPGVCGQEDNFDDSNNMSSAVNKRKRDREIEAQMIKGDMSASNNLDSSVIEFDYTDYQWNKGEHDRKKDKEREIKSIYNVNESAISRTQNSKHQINSLVLKAQEAELRMTSSKPAKTKAQAAAKYGW